MSGNRASSRRDGSRRRRWTRLAVREWGHGRPLVLLHGFLGSGSTWERLAGELESHYRCIAVDLPGHGNSPVPDDRDGYGIADVATDIVVTLETLEVPSFGLLGYSMGGRVAMHAALQHPEPVEVLVTESASPGIEDPDERSARLVRDIELAGDIRRDGMPRFVDYWEELPIFQSQHGLDRAARKAIRASRLATDAEGAAWSIEALSPGRHQPLQPRLSAITVPWLIIAGELDERYRSAAMSMASAAPNARAAIVPGAGHAVHVERPAAFGREVREFLKERWT